MLTVRHEVARCELHTQGEMLRVAGYLFGFIKPDTLMGITG